MKAFYVYILTNSSRVLYVGVTSNLAGRFWEHVIQRLPSFATRYNLDRLVYYEIYPTALEAIEREKQIKSWRRSKKLDLIKTMNTSWRDLSGRLMDRPIFPKGHPYGDEEQWHREDPIR